MKSSRFTVPELNDVLPAPQLASDDVLDFIANRRSTPIKTFDPNADGPSPDELTSMIEVAMRVPDHRRLGPWRTITISGANRSVLGKALAARCAELNPQASDKELALECERLDRAPVCVVVVSSPVDDGKTPVWEQELSAGALCMNLLYVAHASGYAASWLTEWWAFDDKIAHTLGLKPGERIAGNVFIGKSKVDLFERPRPDLADRMSEWSPEAED